MNQSKIALGSDFDGTLYFFKIPGHIKEEDIQAIKEFQKQGGLFGICTGRSLKGVIWAVEGKIDFDFYILASGSFILDKNLRPIYKRCISRELLGEVYNKYKDSVEIVIQANDTVYNLDNAYPMQTKINSLDEIDGDNIYGLSFGANTPEEAEKIAKEINKSYGNVLIAFQNTSNIDIVSKGCSKGNAIKILKEHFNINHIGGIGDSYNDISMLENVDLPFTFPYAPKEVQEKATYIVNNVAEAIQKLKIL